MKALTDRQKAMIAKLEKRGAGMTAAAARDAWQKGETYYLDTRNPARAGSLNAATLKP